MIDAFAPRFLGAARIAGMGQTIPDLPPYTPDAVRAKADECRKLRDAYNAIISTTGFSERKQKAYQAFAACVNELRAMPFFWYRQNVITPDYTPEPIFEWLRPSPPVEQPLPPVETPRTTAPYQRTFSALPPVETPTAAPTATAALQCPTGFVIDMRSGECVPSTGPAVPTASASRFGINPFSGLFAGGGGIQAPMLGHVRIENLRRW